ncbi:MAG: hypothetical protein U5R46_14015 [Gammaproteobacteria bacterium]|nr:hypothetical protein [Gammaproteobacteria bacterium]
MKRLIPGCLALLTAAPALALDLVIDLRTNWAPYADFRYVRVEVMDRTDERNQWRTLHTSGGDFVSGQRVAEFAGLVARRTYYVQVELLDDRFRPVDGDVLLLDMPDANFGMNSLITRP